MKNFLTAFLLLIAPIAILAQTTDVINYQAIVKDSDGNMVKNTPITLIVSIIVSEANGSVVYEETHDITTDDNGYFYTHIGDGETTDNYEAINWGSSRHFLKTEYDFNDGSAFLLAGLSELTSVAYANYANSYDETDPMFNNSVAKGITEADTAFWNNSASPAETDPIFTNSTAKGITEADTATWNYTADINTNKYINAFVGIRTAPDISPITIKAYDPNPSDNLPFAKLIQFNDESNQKSWDMELATNTGGVDFHINQSGVANRMTFKSDGNIGIGTDIPSVKLDVRSKGIDDAAILNLGNSDNSHYISFFAGRENDPNPFIARRDTDPLKFGAFDTDGVWEEQMRIAEDGNVGIGTELPQWDLDIRSNSLTNGATLNLSSSDVNTHYIQLRSGNIADIIWSHGDIFRFGTYDLAAFKEYMRIPSTGGLEMNEGGIEFDKLLKIGDFDANSHIDTYENGHDTPLIYSRYFYGDYGSLIIQGRSTRNEGTTSFSSAAILFVTGGDHVETDSPTERMVIMDDGNIGIGDFAAFGSQPKSKLQIKDGDVYLETIGTGVIMKSPSGACWRMTVDDAGQMQTTSIACPN